MRNIFFIGLVAASVTVTACQSKSYKLEGSGDALKDGDTLYVTADLTNGTPNDTVVVKNNSFELKANADSTYLCVIYNPKKQSVSLPFFVEPGIIKINLSETPGQSKVGGTPINDKWQELNDTTTKIGMQINRIASYIYSNQLSDSEQRNQMAAINKLNDEFKRCVTDCAERNIGNELGYFILTYYPDEIITADQRLSLVNKLPKSMQNRKAMQAIVEKLKQQSKHAIGKTIEDFSMNDINGKQVSILKEIKSHKLTIIDFWASWCGPCRAEMPAMVKMYEVYHAKGLGIIGISLDENHSSWQAAVKSLGMEWTQLSDLQGWNNKAARMFNVESIPHTIVVDQNGTIIEKGLRSGQIEALVASKLK